ncbi:MAG: metallophosphoesterase family protein [Acidobacteriaceae bacterium]|nr:metallophosphoesterase family protein [Acidobacteriaceae bacterium]
MRIAVVSDTHSLLRPELLDALAGAEKILHAGDIGNADHLAVLNEIAPVTAIRGNVDLYGPTAALPATEALEWQGHFVYMLHALQDLDLKPEAAGFSVVIYGHSHRPSIEQRNGVLYLNPGSCGPRRFSLPVSFAWLELEEGKAPVATLQELVLG